MSNNLSIPPEKSLLLFLLRLTLGWLFLYAGLSKVLDPQWSSVGFLTNAKTFGPLYDFFASESNIVWIDFANKWGLTAIGAGLITGAFTTFASIAGIILMVLYYFPVLDFPYAGANGYLIDDHIIYIFSLAIFIKYKAGQSWGLDAAFFRK